MKTLVVCHLEPDFRDVIREELPSQVAKYSRLFDRVIVIESASELSNTPPYDELWQLYDYGRVETWVWGWPDCVEESEGPCNDDEYLVYGEDYIRCEESYHPGAYIVDWMKGLENHQEYYLVGGGRWECLQDVYEIFKHLKLNVRIVESLTY